MLLMNDLRAILCSKIRLMVYVLHDVPAVVLRTFGTRTYSNEVSTLFAMIQVLGLDKKEKEKTDLRYQTNDCFAPSPIAAVMLL
jgi:hypothetical protein